MKLNQKTILVTGASRGIGKAIAHRFAQEGSNIVILSKDSPSQMQEATIEIEQTGAKVLSLDTDISNQEAIAESVSKAFKTFGSIDVLVNNTSATCFTDTLHTKPEQFDLVIATSVRAAFFLSKVCHPYLKASTNPHIINISPPFSLEASHFKNHLAFSIAKNSMSMCTLGMSEEFKQDGIAVNSLWPKTTIATQTIKDHFSSKVYSASRWPLIMGDAALELVMRFSKECTGNFYTDEDLLKETGVTDFSKYSVDKNSNLMQSLFLPKDESLLPVSEDLFLP